MQSNCSQTVNDEYDSFTNDATNPNEACIINLNQGLLLRKYVEVMASNLSQNEVQSSLLILSRRIAGISRCMGRLRSTSGTSVKLTIVVTGNSMK